MASLYYSVWTCEARLECGESGEDCLRAFDQFLCIKKMRAETRVPCWRSPTMQQNCCIILLIVVMILAMGLTAKMDPGVNSSGTWERKLHHPSTLINSAAVYCEGIDLVVVFGGAMLDAQTNRFLATANMFVIDEDYSWKLQSQTSGSISHRVGHSLTLIEDTEYYCDFLVYGSQDSSESTTAVIGRLSLDHDNEEKKILVWGNSSTLEVNEQEGPGLRSRHSMLAVNNDMYLLGGYSSKSVVHDTLWRLRLNRVEEETLSDDGKVNPVPARRNGTWSIIWAGSEDGEGPSRAWDISSVVMKDKYLVFAGGETWDSSHLPTSKSTIWVWSIDEEKWIMSDLEDGAYSFARSSAVAVAYGDDLFMHGGTQVVTYRGRKVDMHKSNLLQTQPLAENPQARCTSINAASSSNSFYCEPSDETISGSVPECRSRHTGVLRKGSLIVFGGISGQECLGISVVLSDMWVLNLSSVVKGNFVTATNDSVSDLDMTDITSMYFLFTMMFMSVVLVVSIVMRRRRVGTFSYMTTEDASRNRGASMSMIRNLPILRFADTGREDECCPICLSDYEPNDELLQLPCGHMFHPECGETWLVKNDSCPLCKRALGTRDIDLSGRKDDETDDEDHSENDAHRAIELRDLSAEHNTSPFASSGGTSSASVAPSNVSVDMPASSGSHENLDQASSSSTRSQPHHSVSLV